jgi:histidyl-tRNA synthetase
MSSLLREHYQWNMDVWGVAGVEAEAELLSSAVAALTSMGLTHRDVVFKVILIRNCSDEPSLSLRSSRRLTAEKSSMD